MAIPHPTTRYMDGSAVGCWQCRVDDGIFTTVFISVVLFVTIQTTECVSCFTCNNVIDDSVCTNNITTCAPGQSCFKTIRIVNDMAMINLGCLDNPQCSSATDVSSIVGRALNRRQTHNCMECCSSNMCNMQLCNHQKPTVCVDDESVDCAKLNSVFNICKDIHHAQSFCPQFCSLCDVVDGEWSKWSEWSHCDVTCNNGTETRTRYCTNPRPEHGGLDCVGDKQEVRSCNTVTECPVHGGWSAWYNWGSCSTSCATGIQRRTRNCTNPIPAYSGDQCFGSNMDARLCSNGPCADGGWSSWSSWSKCSRTCGGGIRSQSRVCNNPVPSLNGHDCIGDPMRVDTCFIDQYCEYSDCLELKRHEPDARDCVYDVVLWKTNRTIRVYCDMTTDGGGWTVFKNRYDGSVDFYRNYSQYVHGFGLEYIQEMTSQAVNELRIDLMAANGTTAYEVFSSFSLSPTEYILNVGNTTSSNNIDLGSSRPFGPYHNGSAFSTYDHDVDSSNGNCATTWHGAWWYNTCYNANLNGQYLTPGNEGRGMIYHSFILNHSLKQSKMSVRRV